MSTKYLLKTLYSLQLTDTITYLYTWWYCSSCWFSLFVYLVSVYHVRDNLGRNEFTVFKKKSSLTAKKYSQMIRCLMQGIRVVLIIIFHSQDLLSRDVLLMFPILIGIIIICDFASWVSLGMSRRWLTIFAWIEIDCHLGTINHTMKFSWFSPQCN